jgi:Antitoxin MazE-like
MAATSSGKSSRANVSAHRRRLRAQGLRPIQICVPDVHAPSLKAQAHRQSRAVATSRQANQDQSFMDTVSDLCLDEGAR